MSLPPSPTQVPTLPKKSVKPQENPREDDGKKIEFAKFINEHNLQLVNHTDTKTSIIIGIDGVLLGLLFSSLPSLEYLFILIPFIISVVLLGLSAFYGLWAIFPIINRDPRYRDSMVYHETILGHELTPRHIYKPLDALAKKIQRHEDEYKKNLSDLYEYLKRWGLPFDAEAISSKFNSSTSMNNDNDDRILYEEVRSVCMLAGKLHHMVTRVRWSLFFLVLAVILLAVTLSTSSSISSFLPSHDEKCSMNAKSYNVTPWQCSQFSKGSLAEQCANNPSKYNMSLKGCSQFIPPTKTTD